MSQFVNVQDEASLIKGVIDLRMDLGTANHINALEPESFSAKPHQMIWQGIQTITRNGGMIDAWALKKEMVKIGASDEDHQFAGSYFTDASYSGGSTSDLSPRVAAVAEAYKRREISRSCSEMAEYALTLDIKDVEARFNDLASKVASAGSSSVKAGTNYEAQFDKILSGKPILAPESRMNLTHFGVAGIDDALMANPGRLIFVGGLPSAGKTAFAIQAGIETALAGRRVAMGSLEMDEDEISARIIANCCSMNSLTALRGQQIPPVSPQDTTKLAKVRKNLIGLHGCAGDSWTSMEAAIVREHRRSPLSLAVLDYLQLLEAPETKGKAMDNEAQRIGEITKAAKRLAQRLKINVMLLSQFNRQVEECKEPTLQNFLGSGQIERDADIALLMWNTVQRDTSDQRKISLRIAKNRGGARWGKVNMLFHAAHNQFIEDLNFTDPVEENAEGFYVRKKR